MFSRVQCVIHHGPKLQYCLKKEPYNVSNPTMQVALCHYFVCLDYLQQNIFSDFTALLIKTWTISRLVKPHPERLRIAQEIGRDLQI